MHMVIRAIVPGEDRREALDNAHEVFQSLVDRGHFDYYATFDDSFARERWGNIPAVVPVESKQGKQLIDEAINSTKRDFCEALDNIRSALAMATNEELFEERLSEGKKGKLDPLFRYYCYCIGQYAGPYIWLYDRYGEGIRNSKDLKWDLERNNEKLWVVPADVHY